PPLFVPLLSSSSFFFIATSTTAIYTLSLHDALPIFILRDGIVWDGSDADPRPADVVCKDGVVRDVVEPRTARGDVEDLEVDLGGDRKSTRLNSSHVKISYAVFCLKKKRNQYITPCRS